MRPFSVLTLALVALPALAAPPALALPDAPRIAFVGNTLVERDFHHGYLETLLINAFPDKAVTFRNLGWSGDTVRCEARSGFGQAADGYKHLARHVADLKPNVVILNYGLNESFAGPGGLDAFKTEFAQLLDLFNKNAAGAQMIILSIFAQEDLGRPLPDPAKQNENVRLYNAAMKQAAESAGHTFIDLYDLAAAFGKANLGKRFTDNSIHPTPAGHKFFGEQVVRQLGLTVPEKWDDRLEQIRKLTVEKNTLFFHRWRPQNETYIFGFRKREQGRNAVEIPQFDPLIAEKEAAIAKLRKN